MTRALPAACASPSAESSDRTGSGEATASTPNRPGDLPIPTMTSNVSGLEVPYKMVGCQAKPAEVTAPINSPAE
jgi:hypothetical protein